jgi:hypothetical protein
MIGIALLTVKTPPPTIPTTIEVVEEELCIIDVERIPINNPTRGLEVVLIRVLAKSLPNNLREPPIKSMLKRNK